MRQIRTKYEGVCIYCRGVVPVGETAFWEEGKGIWHVNCKPSTSTVLARSASAGSASKRRIEAIAILAIIVVSSVAIGIIVAPYLGRVPSTSQNQIAQDLTPTSISTSTSASTQNPKWKSSSAKVVSYTQASSYVGQVVTVEGTIVNTFVSGGTTFLDFHYPYKGYFSAVIFASDAGNFKFSPKDFYLNKEVRITGTIQLYQGDPEIILSSPSQIEVAYVGFSYP